MNDTTRYSEDRQRRILAIARAVVEQVLYGQRPTMPEVGDDEDDLKEPCGCFVTLHHRHGRLRGCIGTFIAESPLVENIVRMAEAACRDPRFVYADPVTLAEINDLVIEVSILTPMQRIDDPTAMRLGIDGIYIKAPDDNRSGCFLPQVAPEQGWDVQQTLEFCCSHKMGLPPDAWRTQNDLEFYVFQSDVISEGKA